MSVKIADLIVPAADQDRALRFYADVLGFEKRADLAFGGGLRWIEVARPARTPRSRSARPVRA